MKLKKFLSALVSGAMILGTLAAVPVFAEDATVKNVNEFKSAVAFASIGDTITLNADIDLSGDTAFTMVKPITIDLNDKTLRLASHNDLYDDSKNNGTYTIKNGNIDCRDIVCNSGEGLIRLAPHQPTRATKLNLESVNIDAKGVTNAYTGLIVFEYGEVNLNNVQIDADAKGVSPIFYSMPTAPRALTITNSTINAGKNNVIYGAVGTISSSTITAESEAANVGGVISCSQMTIKDSKMDITGNGNAFYVYPTYDFTSNVQNTTITLGSDVNLFKNTKEDGSVPESAGGSIAMDPVTAATVGEKAAGYVATAKIGDNLYSTFAEALAAAEDGDTVKLLSDASGNGVSIMAAEAKDITIDLGGYTYTVSGGAVGSTNYETQGFHLEKGSNITIKNGTITSTADSGVKMLVQNYCNLKLEDVTLDGSNIPGSNRYVLSNNCGNTVLKGNTNIVAKSGDVAFDCYYWPSNGYTEGVTVTLGTDFTGTITGKIEMTNDGTDTANAASKQDISISGGTFTTDVSAYCADGFSPKLVNGVYVVNNVPAKVYIKFVPTADKNVYDITLVGENSEIINRLNSAELAFNNESDKVAYEILEKENSGIVINGVAGKPDSYEFHFNGKDFGEGTTPDTANSIVIGQVKFTGYGAVTFKVETSNVNEVHTTTKIDNIVDTYVVGGSTSGNGELVVNEAVPNESDGKNYGIIGTTFTVPTQDLTVNVAFNNAIADNAVAYQDMKAVISGGDLMGDITVYFGKNAPQGTENAELNGKTYSFTKPLTQNVTYTVTVSGAGYRTARYTVNMNDNKTLNFWNNVMDTAQVVEVNKPDSAVKTNFLAGDIVKDNNINIYDLSAVVSYFGETGLINENGDANAYARYDLNRDGKIDSKDVAYVLVSWNN
ncbi:MAG: dockerin type I domain-containing protein [Monoglobaceae bacterium]